MTPWTAAHQASLSITNSWRLLKFMSVELVISSNHLILCHPLLLPSIFPRVRVFSKESVLPIRCPKCWSFGFIISPSNEYSRLISFRMDWLDLPAVQGTLKCLLQHHSGSAGKESACNAGDLDLIPELGRPLDKGKPTPSSIPAWRIPWTEETGGLQSTGSQRVGYD